jgi:hypothetical protein
VDRIKEKTVDQLEVLTRVAVLSGQTVVNIVAVEAGELGDPAIQAIILDLNNGDDWVECLPEYGDPYIGEPFVDGYFMPPRPSEEYEWDAEQRLWVQNVTVEPDEVVEDA